MSKIGLDFHEAGAKLVTAWLRESGFEVIYLGLFQTPDMIAEVALQEDVDIIGISHACGAHIELVTELMEKLRERGISNIPVVLGGTMPPQDVPVLKELGVKNVFLPGSSTQQISNVFRSLTKTEV